jgi:hypothetical protein
LRNSESIGKNTDFIGNREGGFEAVILYADFSALCGNVISCALYGAKPFPTIGAHCLTVPFARQAGFIERKDCPGGPLIQVILNQLSNKIVAIETNQEIPKSRNAVKPGNKVGR